MERKRGEEGQWQALEFPAIASSQRESLGAVAPRVTSSHHLPIYIYIYILGARYTMLRAPRISVQRYRSLGGTSYRFDALSFPRVIALLMVDVVMASDTR